MAQHKGSGHPARQDPDVRRLFKTMVAGVELVRDLEGRLTDENYLKLRAAALGLMFAYADVAQLPAPDAAINEVFSTVMSERLKDVG